ncbi:MAG: 4-hydroxy-3-methylbut-2-enyl diphosphate reductase [Treponema sp.]|nr:4-hydroxy-3-methylbut-2-enyl diphosphate reductase [Treponema sp.]
MEVLRAKIMGFCSGVRRAVESAANALDENDGGVVYTFGPLIHNPVVLKKFFDRGLRVCSEDEIHRLKKTDTVLIRAHGVPPEIERKLLAASGKVIDATCPLVKMSQKRAAEFASKNYNIIFAGDKNHGEVIGIEGHAAESYRNNGFKANFLLVRDLADLKEIFAEKKLDFDRKTVLLSQTTFNIPIFEEISAFLKEQVPDVTIVSSICNATHERQGSLEKLCAEVDGVLVIGGKTSANTSRLFESACKKCRHAALIECADDIPEEFFSLGKVGITAGASTPDDVIDEVQEKLEKMFVCKNGI